MAPGEAVGAVRAETPARVKYQEPPRRRGSYGQAVSSDADTFTCRLFVAVENPGSEHGKSEGLRQPCSRGCRRADQSRGRDKLGPLKTLDGILTRRGPNRERRVPSCTVAAYRQWWALPALCALMKNSNHRLQDSNGPRCAVRSPPMRPGIEIRSSRPRVDMGGDSGPRHSSRPIYAHRIADTGQHATTAPSWRPLGGQSAALQCAFRLQTDMVNRLQPAITAVCSMEYEPPSSTICPSQLGAVLDRRCLHRSSLATSLSPPCLHALSHILPVALERDKLWNSTPRNHEKQHICSAGCAPRWRVASLICRRWTQDGLPASSSTEAGQTRGAIAADNASQCSQ